MARDKQNLLVGFCGSCVVVIWLHHLARMCNINMYLMNYLPSISVNFTLQSRLLFAFVYNAKYHQHHHHHHRRSTYIACFNRAISLCTHISSPKKQTNNKHRLLSIRLAWLLTRRSIRYVTLGRRFQQNEYNKMVFYWIFHLHIHALKQYNQPTFHISSYNSVVFLDLIKGFHFTRFYTSPFKRNVIFICYWIISCFFIVWFFLQNLNRIPKTQFQCKGRPAGYYADVQAGEHIWQSILF